ncbi:RNA-binding protein [Bacillus coahuilensis]|uniref:YlmH family RNA-binding protein n=1 Tax=Bacillus coahuilensis TaxID=408580 RepID=UPI0001850E76|nr:RNA-binding protein [Bacillus coahuilensis]
MHIYQHFRPEEKEFIDTVIRWKEEVANQYAPKLTDFLHPRERQIVEAIIGSQSEVLVSFEGLLPDAERKRCLIYPDYFQPKIEDFDLALLEVEYPRKFITLEHRQILGALMSLGIRREKYGDILLSDDRIQLIAANELKSYITLQFTEVGKSQIELIEKNRKEIIQPNEEWSEYQTTVSSLRLDVMLSTLLKISRNKAQAYITTNKVKVNWREEDRVSFICEPGDMISVRGKGRLKIFSLDGQTKREKWKVTAGLLK